MKYTPPSITDIGLKKFLNESAKKHNGLDYTNFVTFIDAKVNITNIARAFNVSRPTGVNWLEIHRQEQELGVHK